MNYLLLFIVPLAVAVIFIGLAAILAHQRCAALEIALQVLYQKHSRLDGRFAEVQRRKYL